jgi:hypothetical protein
MCVGCVQLSATTRYIIKYVYKAVSRQKNSIIEKLEEEFPDKRTSDYISFYSLRTWGRLQVRTTSAITIGFGLGLSLPPMRLTDHTHSFYFSPRAVP